jgi:hypothetical protein
MDKEKAPRSLTRCWQANANLSALRPWMGPLQGGAMQPISFKQHRFPPDAIRHAVWLYSCPHSHDTPSRWQDCLSTQRSSPCQATVTKPRRALSAIASRRPLRGSAKAAAAIQRAGRRAAGTVCPMTSCWDRRWRSGRRASNAGSAPQKPSCSTSPSGASRATVPLRARRWPRWKGPRAARGDAGESRTFIVRWISSPGRVGEALTVLRMAVTHDADRPTARVALEPWLVERALERLGDRRLSREEQETVMKATRRPKKVRWPAWWEVRSG